MKSTFILAVPFILLKTPPKHRCERLLSYYLVAPISTFISISLFLLFSSKVQNYLKLSKFWKVNEIDGKSSFHYLSLCAEIKTDTYMLGILRKHFGNKIDITLPFYDIHTWDTT